jgi:hypothetical protein
VSVYPFIEAEKAEERSVNRTCAVLEVSRAAYYEWHKQEPSRRGPGGPGADQEGEGDLRGLPADLRFAAAAPGAAATGREVLA